MNIDQILHEYDNMFGVKPVDEIEDFLVRRIEAAFEEQDLPSAVTLMNEMLGLCRESGHKEKGLGYSRRLRTVLDEMGMGGTPGYAATLLNIANMNRAFGDYEAASDCYREAEKIYKKERPEGAFDFASLYNNWGLLYQEWQEDAESVKMLERALCIVDAYPDAAIEQATTRTNLAGVLLRRSQTEKTCESQEQLRVSAMEYLHQAMERFEQAGGEDFHYSAALSAMGDACYISCDYRKSALYYRRAMEHLERYVGRSQNYRRVEEKYRKSLEKASHIDRCREFYERYGMPAIHNKFPEYESRIAVGIVGEGSDCFGYDDEISRDHDYAVGFCMWLAEADYKRIGTSLQREYEKIYDEHAKEYNECIGRADLTVQDTRISRRRGVFEIRCFYENILRIHVPEDQELLSENRQWLAVEEENLAAAVNGEIFRDDAGIFSTVRRRIMDYYPEAVWRRRLAEQIHIFSQNGQYNYARMMAREDYVTANLCIAHAMESAMAIVYLLNRTYAPYYKWKRMGLRDLTVLPEIGKLLDDLSEMENQKRAWSREAYDSCKVNTTDKKANCIEKIALLILEELNRQKIIAGENKFLDIYCRKIAGGDRI